MGRKHTHTQPQKDSIRKGCLRLINSVLDHFTLIILTVYHSFPTLLILKIFVFLNSSFVPFHTNQKSNGRISPARNYFNRLSFFSDVIDSKNIRFLKLIICSVSYQPKIKRANFTRPELFEELIKRSQTLNQI